MLLLGVLFPTACCHLHARSTLRPFWLNFFAYHLEPSNTLWWAKFKIATGSCPVACTHLLSQLFHPT